MRSGQSSDNLLSHFDRPRVVTSPDFDWDEAAIGPSSFECPSLSSAPLPEPREDITEVAMPVRDIGWVVKWAAAIAVFVTAGRYLVEFAGTIATEHALHQAAQAGVVEATLPRASRQSVLDTVERRLAKTSIDARQLNLTLLENDIPITGRIHPTQGDRISVVLSADVGSAWSWFNKNGRAPLTVRSEREVPGRRLKPPTR